MKVEIEVIKSSDMNRQEFTTSDSRGQNAKEDNDNLGLSLLDAKPVGEFEERLEQLQRLYVGEAKMFQRELK